MHAKEFLDGFLGSSRIRVAGIELACRMLGRDCGVGRLLGGVGSLGLFDFVRLLVHAETVSRRRCGVNGGGKKAWPRAPASGLGSGW